MNILRLRASRCNGTESLEALLVDPSPEVRAAAVYALGTLDSSQESRTKLISSKLS